MARFFPGLNPAKLEALPRSLWFILFASLFCLQAVPRIWTDSPYTDEAWETTTGYYYWTQGDVTSPLNHPPLGNALEALPLLFMDLHTDPRAGAGNENRAYALHYVSNLPQLDLMVEGPRWVAFLFTLGMGFLFFLWVRREKSPVFFLALTLWAFEPTLLAFSIVSKADAPFNFFCAAALMAFLKAQKEERPAWDLLAGALSGMAATSKLTGLGLLPVFLALDLWEGVRKGIGPARRWGLGILGALAVVFAVYLPGTISHRDFFFPFTCFYQRVVESVRIHSGLPILQMPHFFAGKYYARAQWWQFPVILALKSTLPFTLLLALGTACLVFRKILVPSWVWLFPLGWTACLLLFPLANLRYLVPAYPALILLAAKGGGWLWDKGKERRSRILRQVTVLLALWTAASTVANFPNHVGYFNDLVLPDRKWSWLDYHYIDLDQDLKRLGKTARERGWRKIKLAYTGQDDPYYFGLPLWEPWSQADLEGPQPGTTYAVQAVFLKAPAAESDPDFPIRRSWVARVKPTGQVGETWLYFEAGGTPRPDVSPLLPSTPYLVFQNAPYRRAATPVTR